MIYFGSGPATFTHFLYSAFVIAVVIDHGISSSVHAATQQKDDVSRLTRSLQNEETLYQWNIDSFDHGASCRFNLVAGFGCQGDYCQTGEVYCILNHPTDIDHSEVTGYPFHTDGGQKTFSTFSEEDGPVLCSDDYFMQSVFWSGAFGDNISIGCHFTMSRRSAPADQCVWTDWVSEEGSGRLIFEEGYFARGMECRGHYCDDKRFYVCPVIDRTGDTCHYSNSPFFYGDERDGLLEFGPSLDDDIFTDRDVTGFSVCDQFSECDDLFGSVFADRPQAVAGVSIHGPYGERALLLCEYCNCDFPTTESYWTEEFSEENGPMICATDSFLTGMTASKLYGDNVALRCTLNSGRTAGEGCSWTKWISEESDNIIFPVGMLARGVECRGHYCDDKRFFICPAVDEETVCIY